MSILIKGMEMPTRCGRCDLCIPVFDFGHYECCITAAVIDNLGEKMEDCPLVPVPYHRRLVDADALASMYDPNTDFGKSVRDMITDCPTIIPASEEGET